MKKGFTLIELLVVIAIIGLLTSIVLISTRGGKDQAKYANYLQFDGQIKSYLGTDILGEWLFEESGDDTCSGGMDFCDTSGNNLHGENIGGVGRIPNTASPQLGKAGNFDRDTFVQVKSPFLGENEKLDKYTMTFWVSTGANNYTWFALNAGASTPAHLFFYYSLSGEYTTSMAFITTTDIAGEENNHRIACPLGSSFFKSNEWHFFGITYNGSKLAMYKDGQKCNEVDATGKLKIINSPSQPSDTFLNIGTYVGNGVVGRIDQVRIYKQGLHSAQIEKMYVKDLFKIGLTSL